MILEGRVGGLLGDEWVSKDEDGIVNSLPQFGCRSRVETLRIVRILTTEKVVIPLIKYLLASDSIFTVRQRS